MYCKFPSNAYIYLKKSSIVFGKTAEDLFIFYGEKLINVLFSLFHFLVSSTHEDHDVVYQCSQ